MVDSIGRPTNSGKNAGDADDEHVHPKITRRDRYVIESIEGRPQRRDGVRAPGACEPRLGCSSLVPAEMLANRGRGRGCGVCATAQCVGGTREEVQGTGEVGEGGEEFGQEGEIHAFNSLLGCGHLRLALSGRRIHSYRY